MTNLTISAVGDVMAWQRQIDAARTGGGYDFRYVFNDIAPRLKADLVIGNLETTLSGPKDGPWVTYQKVRGWPLFNCPDEMAAAVKHAGFDLMTTANNHCLDQGGAGLNRTLDLLDQYGLKHTGTFRTEAESQTDLIIDLQGVRVGVLSYTYGTNFMPAPPDAPWCVNLHSEATYGAVRAMKRKADLVVVCQHWGQEFVTVPSTGQRQTAQACWDHGADIVFGCHSHVIQTARMRPSADLDGDLKNRLVVYSMGNFSSATMEESLATLLGMAVKVRVGELDGMLQVRGFETILTYCDPAKRWAVREI